MYLWYPQGMVHFEISPTKLKRKDLVATVCHGKLKSQDWPRDPSQEEKKP